ncbi:DMT family transporter [Erythrobacter dokdonensis]|uniref:Integral membrane protein n=1 Tax=Erythrobacter dokdonensis DSW-74 TaxID=1300349 RepID=A0A1A7BL83_9SPHN|nr:DMT family transporter [Erythrobacter dokdonensis]OBV12242.1 Integral membrane protein [Erythrobacter dokdonensis DSW-74]
MPANLPFSALAIMLFCNVAWAMNVVVSKIAVSTLGLPPLFYTVLRSAVVLVVLFPLLRDIPARLLLVLAVGFAITGGSFGLQFVGLQTASPSAVGIVNLAGAPLTVLFAIIFLGEEVRWRRGIGMVLALGGVGLAIGSPTGSSSLTGLAFAFAGVLIGAFASVFVKRLAVGAVALQAWAAVASIAVMLPATLAMESGQVAAVEAAPMAVAGCVLFAGLVVSVGAHSAYFRLFQRHDANLIVPLTLLTPLLTIAFGTWLTGDRIGWPLLTGGALALAGVAIIVIRPSRNIFKPLLVRPRL